MHSTEQIVYNDITLEHFAALEKLAQKSGLYVVGISGRTKKDGYEISWDYEEESQTLTIKIIQSPFYVPDKVIEYHFDTWIKDTTPVTAPTTVLEVPKAPEEPQS